MNNLELPTIENISYEQAILQLESIITALESDEKTLDEALQLFDDGQALVRRCTELLNLAELKIKQITENEIADFALDE